MTDTTYHVHAPDGSVVPVDSPRDAEYLSRVWDMRVTAVTEGSA